MQYHRAQDFEQIFALQNRNLLSVLNVSERSEGFLNTAFTVQQFQEMDQSLGVIAAVDQGQVCGYIGAGTLTFYSKFLFPAALIQYAEKLNYQQRPLISYRCCIVNPLCIEKKYRGSGIFMELSQAMCDLVSVNYEIALAFVSIANQRSLHACQKMMQIMGQFVVENEIFLALIRDLRLSLKPKIR